MTCPRTQPRSTGCGASCGSRWRRAPSALSSGLDYPPGAFASTAELAALTAEAARLGGIYHTHVRYPLGDGFLDPFREAIEIGRSGRRSGAHHPLLSTCHRARFRGADDRPGRGRPGRGPGRDLGHLSLRVGEHAAAHHAAALGPGRRPGSAPRAPRGPGHPGAAPGRARGTRPGIRGSDTPGTTSAWARCAPMPGGSGRAGRSGS